MGARSLDYARDDDIGCIKTLFLFYIMQTLFSLFKWNGRGRCADAADLVVLNFLLPVFVVVLCYMTLQIISRQSGDLRLVLRSLGEEGSRFIWNLYVFNPAELFDFRTQKKGCIAHPFS